MRKARRKASERERERPKRNDLKSKIIVPFLEFIALLHNEQEKSL